MGAPGGLSEFSRKFVFGTCYYKYSLKWCWVERAVHYRFSKKKLVETAIWSPCLTAGWTAPWSPCISTPFRNRETKCHHMALTKTWIEEFFFSTSKNSAKPEVPQICPTLWSARHNFFREGNSPWLLDMGTSWYFSWKLIYFGIPKWKQGIFNIPQSGHESVYRGVAASRFVGRQDLVAHKGLVLTLGSMITIPMVWSM